MMVYNVLLVNTIYAGIPGIPAGIPGIPGIDGILEYHGIPGIPGIPGIRGMQLFQKYCVHQQQTVTLSHSDSCTSHQVHSLSSVAGMISKEYFFKKIFNHMYVCAGLSI